MYIYLYKIIYVACKWFNWLRIRRPHYVWTTINDFICISTINNSGSGASCTIAAMHCRLRDAKVSQHMHVGPAPGCRGSRRVNDKNGRAGLNASSRNSSRCSAGDGVLRKHRAADLARADDR
jgi:hypothetical protein